MSAETKTRKPRTARILTPLGEAATHVDKASSRLAHAEAAVVKAKTELDVATSELTRIAQGPKS